jgi:hypothetical protein
VPWFHEWKTADGLLDFNDDVNKQLCTLFKLTKSESSYVTKYRMGDKLNAAEE